MRDLSSLTSTDFDAVLGTDFQVVDSQVADSQVADFQVTESPLPESPAAEGGRDVEIRLTEVAVGPERPGHRQPFSLRFRGPAAPLLDSRTYRLVHAELGELEIFLVPIAAEGGGLVYEAVFT